MKKIILILMLSMMMSISSAETITILNNGKPGGSFHARTQMYKDGLLEMGYEVKYENIGKIAQAVEIFKETDKPTIMVYSTNQSYTQDLFHNEDNLILIEYEQPMWICKSNNAKNKKNNLTVAHGKGYDTDLLLNALGTDIVLIPYKNSSAILNGILAGDVDIAVNNQGSSIKYAASGQGVCAPAEELPVMQATLIGTNVDVEKLRQATLIIVNSPAFVEYHTKRKLTRPNVDRLAELELINKKQKGWKIN